MSKLDQNSIERKQKDPKIQDGIKLKPRPRPRINFTTGRITPKERNYESDNDGTEAEESDGDSGSSLTVNTKKMSDEEVIHNAQASNDYQTIRQRQKQGWEDFFEHTVQDAEEIQDDDDGSESDPSLVRSQDAAVTAALLEASRVAPLMKQVTKQTNDEIACRLRVLYLTLSKYLKIPEEERDKEDWEVLDRVASETISYLRDRVTRAARK